MIPTAKPNNGLTSHPLQMAKESAKATTAGVPMTSTIAAETKKMITLLNDDTLRPSAGVLAIWMTVRTNADADSMDSGMPRAGVARTTAKQAAVKAMINIKESMPNE
jgi:hypothetical protein